MEVYRRSSWLLLLLGISLLATTLQVVQGEVELEGPSESECRPYIEKALKELETGEAIVPGHSGEADSKEDIPTVEITTDDSDHDQVVGEHDTDDDGKDAESTETVDSLKSAENDDSEEHTDTEDDDSDEEQDASTEDTEAQGDEAEKAGSAESKESHEAPDLSSQEGEDGATEEDTKESGEAEDKQEESVEGDAASTEDHDDSAQASSKEEQAEGAQASEEHDDAEGGSKEGDSKEDQKGESREAQDESDEAAHAKSVEDSKEDQGESKEEHGESKEDHGESHEDHGESKEDHEESLEDEKSKEGDSKEDQGQSKEDQGESKEDQGESKEDQGESKEDHAVSKEDQGESAEDHDSKEGDSKEGDSKEGDSKEGVSKEGDSKEGDSKEGDSKEGDSKEGDSKEGDSKERDSKERDSKGDSKADSKEEDSKEQAESKEDDAASKEDHAESAEEVAEEVTAKTVKGVETAADADESTETGEQPQGDAPAEDELAPESDEGADDGKSGEDKSEGGKSTEEAPEEDLTQEIEIPTDLRPREHVYQLLKLDESSVESEKIINKAAEITLRDLKKLYENAIKPLETLYKYRDLSNRHFGDAEIFSKPLVLFMGPWSGGKSSIINYLLDNEYNETTLRTGAEPSPAYFNILMHGDEPEILDGTQLAADFTFSGLQKFGQGLEERLRGLKLPSKLLEKINIVEIPGILEVRKQVSRVFPFNDACQWFIDRADIIFLVYDPSKLDVGPETEAILDQLKGREYQTRIILNKADQVKPEELMRVQGALIWNISPLMSSAQPPVMYTASLWSRPYEQWAPVRLLQAQERAFLRDLRSAIDKRIDNKISSARRFAVRVRNHAKMVDCYLTTYYNHKSVFGNKKLVSDQIIEHPQDYHIYEGLSTLTNISRYDLPDPEVYRGFFKLNPLYDFQQLSATCTYFRGCPINRLDIAIAYDLPELVGKHKRILEAALAEVNQSQTPGS